MKLFKYIFIPVFITNYVYCSLELSSLAVGSVISTGAAVQMMRSKTSVGVLNAILASNPVSISFNHKNETESIIHLPDLDGDTTLIISSLLYYYSITSTFNLNGPSLVKIGSTTYPWLSNLNFKDSSMKYVKEINHFLKDNLNSAIIIPLSSTNFDGLTFLAVITVILKNSWTYPMTDVLVRNLLRQTGAIKYMVQKKEIKLKNRLESFRNTLPSTKLDDMEMNYPKLTIVPSEIKYSSRNNSKLNYGGEPWYNDAMASPRNITSLFELETINNYLADHFEGLNFDRLPEFIRNNNNLIIFSVALILYCRERQFDYGSVDIVNIDQNPKFRRLLLRYNHGYFKTDIPSWKKHSDLKWKSEPFVTFRKTIQLAYADEIRGVRYISSNWNKHDFVIASIVAFYTRLMKLPSIYRQNVVYSKALEKEKDEVDNK